MCGIVGFVDKKNKYSVGEKKKLIQAMRQKIAHRGNDSYGEYIKNNIALGHARLSILDTSSRGAQPMQTNNKQFVITYNGEIYNHQDVRQKIGYKSTRTKTDTETILAAYQCRGKQCLKNFKGMWAFGILDANNNKLFLSIDRFGIKPLYYVHNDDFFAFASEIKALLALPGIMAQINKSALSEYLLFRSIAGRETMFQKIQKLLPAESLSYHLHNNEIVIEKYWNLTKKSHKNIKAKKELLALLNKSVKEHLLADVPVGIQLSGGVDSSLVALLAARHKKTRFHSFVIGLPQAQYNEFRYARVVAKKIKSIHHELAFTELNFCKLLPTLTYHADEPINHEHSIPMYFLAKYARTRVKALLSGEGADEVFGGYQRYEALLANRKWKNPELAIISAFGNKAITKMFKTRFVSLSGACNTREKLLNNMPNSWNTFDKVSALDIKTYLVPLLMRQDKMGMAATLENRVPFLDHKLIEFGFSLPVKYKLQNHNNPWKRTKPLLKEIAASLLPSEIVYRKKVGFGLPLGKWLCNKNGLGKYLVLLLTSRRSFYNKPAILRAIREHQSKTKDHAQTLWILLSLELWARIFLDKENPKTIWTSLRQRQ